MRQRSTLQDICWSLFMTVSLQHAAGGGVGALLKGTSTHTLHHNYRPPGHDDTLVKS